MHWSATGNGNAKIDDFNCRAKSNVIWYKINEYMYRKKISYNCHLIVNLLRDDGWCLKLWQLSCIAMVDGARGGQMLRELGGVNYIYIHYIEATQLTQDHSPKVPHWSSNQWDRHAWWVMNMMSTQVVRPRLAWWRDRILPRAQLTATCLHVPAWITPCVI